MATETKKTEPRKQAHPRRRKRRTGVPALLVIFLLIISLAFGGLVGFAIARNTNPLAAQLQAANAKIIELENTLTLIGFSTDEDSVDEFIFDDNAAGDGLDQLAGETAAEESGEWESLDGWEDETVLEGTLTEPEAPVVVAEFKGGNLMSSEVIPEYNDQLTTQIFAGYAAEEIADDLLQEVLSYMVSDKIIAVKAKEAGMDTLTNEDLADINKEAADIYNELVTYYSAFVAEDGMTEEDAAAAAKEYLRAEEATTLESITQELKDTWWAQKFYNHTVKDVTVTDAEVQEQYNTILADQKEMFETYPEEFEYAAYTGETVLYNLDGYRAVKHILIPFADEESAAAATDIMDQMEQLNPETDYETITAYQQQLNALFEPLEATAEEIIGRLNAGDKFESLMAEYSADTDSLVEPLSKTGYFVSADTLLWSAEFIEGSMMLQNVGEISTPLRSPSGLHIVQYAADIKPGAVSITEVYNALKQETLELKQADYYEAQRDIWLTEADAKFYPERLQ
ncbi:MAG: peptidylprolyl isomerase [Clostridia bacterium]|nr:peptidylprolyl isomerase [Clostridia bacterium]